LIRIKSDEARRIAANIAKLGAGAQAVSRTEGKRKGRLWVAAFKWGTPEGLPEQAQQ